MSEANIKIGLLEKKVESIDSEIARQVAVERKETERMKEAKDNQERYVCVSLSSSVSKYECVSAFKQVLPCFFWHQCLCCDFCPL